MIKIIASLIPNKKLRRKFRQFCYTIQIRHTAKYIGNNLYCGKFSTVNKNTIIGHNVRLNGFHISGNGKVIIGNNSVLGFESLIISDSHNYKGKNLPYDETFIEKTTIIEDFVWVGARAIILPGAKIGEGAIIQAGSVVHGEIPPLAIAGRNPAVIFSWREKGKYYSLKKQYEINSMKY